MWAHQPGFELLVRGGWPPSDTSSCWPAWGPALLLTFGFTHSELRDNIHFIDEETKAQKGLVDAAAAENPTQAGPFSLLEDSEHLQEGGRLSCATPACPLSEKAAGPNHPHSLRLF